MQRKCTTAEHYYECIHLMIYVSMVHWGVLQMILSASIA